MPQVRPKVVLLKHTPNPEQVVALAAKLCYSDADIMDLKEGVEEKDVSKFIARLVSLGHLSPIEHASFTFGIEGVSRSLLAQITEIEAKYSLSNIGATQRIMNIMDPQGKSSSSVR